MKRYLSILLTLLAVNQALKAEEWYATRADFIFENDADVRTDRGYTQGAKLYTLIRREDTNGTWFDIPFMEPYSREHFISFSVAQQMFTPEDLTATEPIVGDQPYAGWLYFQTSLHQSSQDHLDSLSLKLGIVGQHAYMEDVQKFIHWLIGSPDPEGWGNQLGSKPGLQLDYQHKWRYLPEDIWKLESDIIPYVSAELGNVSIKSTIGAEWRVGYNIPHDFGESPIDEYGDSGVPTTAELEYSHASQWSYYFTFGVGASAVLYDYFLDGTTLNGKQLVEKYYARGFGLYGATLRYSDFSLSYMRTHYTKLYTSQQSHTNFGSLQFSYHF